MLCRRKQEEARSSRVDGSTEENRLMVAAEASGQGGMADAASSFSRGESISLTTDTENESGRIVTRPSGCLCVAAGAFKGTVQ